MCGLAVTTAAAGVNTFRNTEMKIWLYCRHRNNSGNKYIYRYRLLVEEKTILQNDDILL